MTGVVCPCFGRADDKICPSQSAEINTQIREKLKTASRLRGENISFFIGLYSNVDKESRGDLSQAIKSESVDAILKVQASLAEELAKDKRKFKTWLSQKDLGNQVEVQSFPENNFFILFKTSIPNAAKIICAAASGDLPKNFFDLGF